MKNALPPWLAIAPTIAGALEAGRPVVAFESTVFAHGLPKPMNLEVAERLEAIAEDEGCAAATIGILRGKLHVGLTEAMRRRLGQGKGVAKVNLSNLPALLASGQDGATTVAATMLACDLAGIEVFVTGGIGGVHPMAGEEFDISADLTALGRFRVTVVSAGAKAILDVGATLEALETKGVPVIGYRTDRFPTFYRPASEFNVDAEAKSVRDAARIVRSHRTNPHSAGLLLAVPIPEADALPQELLDEAIAKAHADAARLGIRGRGVTPFLLGALEHHTGARSLAANRALLENNARVGAKLARELLKKAASP